MAKVFVRWDNQRGLLMKVGINGTEVRTNALGPIMVCHERRRSAQWRGQ